MSRENVEIVRAVYHAYERGDIAIVRTLTDPDLAWQLQSELPEAKTLRGTDEVLEWMTSWDDQFTDHRIEPEEFIDLGDRVLVLSRVSGRGRVSDAGVELRTSHLFTLRNGRIIHVRGFFDRGKALEAAGLPQ